MQYNQKKIPSVCLMALPPGLLESTHIQMKRCKKRDVPQSAERREVKVGQHQLSPTDELGGGGLVNLERGLSLT